MSATNQAVISCLLGDTGDPMPLLCVGLGTGPCGHNSTRSNTFKEVPKITLVNLKISSTEMGNF